MTSLRVFAFSTAVLCLPAINLPAAAAPAMPDAALSGCDVLLTAPAGHHCLLPWPNDAFTVKASTPTTRRLNVARKIADCLSASSLMRSG